MARRKIEETPVINSDYAYFDLEIRPSKIHRWGVYAKEDIPKRRRVMEYTGERISRRETKRRSDLQHKLIYLFTVDSYWCLDGAVGGSGAERVNHCCDPNLQALITGGRIFYVARRDIKAGEELTIDYHFSKDVERVPCKCGSKICRGTINVLG